ncbi:hypothetical protein ACIP6X_02555 [Streptomyces coeruleorubidus]|uniref:hypothetical protein n=1 Tax=Streptomyces coeruleorubidus TaxID=116188 RepID=UPI0037F65895
MAHRPYPDRERALRQIMRRRRNKLPPHLLPVGRPPQGPVGAYVLSTRRLSVVSGGA